MPPTHSNPLPLGTTIPEFQLPDIISGETISPSTFASAKAFLLMVICRHCPYVMHVKEELARLGRDYAREDVGIVAISSNDANSYPEDAPVRLKVMAEDLGFTFPFCYDESQETAKAFGAVCTPEFFVFDGQRKLVYHGQLDDSRPGNDRPIDGHDLRAALDAVVVGQPVSQDQKSSSGCSIKWKNGGIGSKIAGAFRRLLSRLTRS